MEDWEDFADEDNVKVEDESGQQKFEGEDLIDKEKEAREKKEREEENK